MAKAFKFRAQPVLRLRQQAEQATMRRLAQARSRVNAIDEEIRRLRGLLSQQDQLVRTGMLTGAVDIQYLSLYRRHVMALHRRVIDQANLFRTATLEFQQARGAALEARKRRRVLTTLKDKQFARYRAHLARLEQRQMDEVGSIGYSRRQMMEES
jgi:flagellar export protein FliJ